MRAIKTKVSARYITDTRRAVRSLLEQEHFKIGPYLDEKEFSRVILYVEEDDDIWSRLGLLGLDILIEDALAEIQRERAFPWVGPK